MQFRCYSCGFVFSKGIPPIEALDENQAAAVGGVVDHEARFDLLKGTKFEGMSTYQFCSFCLLVIRDFPMAIEHKTDMPGHKMVWSGITNKITCECHLDFQVPNGSLGHMLGNRWMYKHIAHVWYEDYNWLRVHQALNMGLDVPGGYGEYIGCDWCDERVPSRGILHDYDGGAVMTICEDCDNKGHKPTMPSINDYDGEEPF